MSRILKHRRISREHTRRDEGKRRAIRRLFAERLEPRVLLATVTSVDPPANSHNAPVSTNIAATFDQNINAATATVQTFAVHSERSGQLVAASVNTDSQMVTFDPATNFFPGERVQVTATAGIQSTSGDPNVPRSWEFFTAVSSGSGQFVQNGQALSSHRTRGVAMGDLDGDGDLDVLQGNDNLSALGYGDPNRVWLNDGTGNLTDSGQLMADHSTWDVALGDLDGDGDLDYMSANAPVQANRVWFNEGGGRFTNGGQLIGNLSSFDVEFGDVDGDGDLDAYVGNYSAPNRLYLNDGNGQFTDSGQSLGNSSSYSVSLGDLDGDGDLDAFVANGEFRGEPNRVWLNDGGGVFIDSGQSLGTNEDVEVRLGDMDGDGDLDAVDSHRLWLNDGSAVFTDSAQSIGTGNNRVGIGDVDGDGDLDIFNNSNVVYVLLNNGSGVFTDSGQSLATSRDGSGLELGDLDADGDLDTYVVHRSQPDVVWINQNLSPSVTLSVDNSTIPEAAGTATITATLSAAHTDPVTVELGISGTAAVTVDYTVSGTQIVIPTGATTGTVTITAVQDTVDEADETVIVDVTSLTNAREAGIQQVTTTVLDDDEPVMPDVTLSATPTEIPEAAGVSTIEVTLSEVTTAQVTIDLAVAATTTATQTADYNVSGLQISISPGSTTGSVTVTAVQDEVSEPNETVTLEIASVTGGNELGQQSATITILDDDIPPSFRLSSFTSTSGGFQATLTAELDTSVLNLGDTQTGGHGPADATLVGTTTGAIAGSLVVAPDGRAIEFLATGDRLPADTYTVTLRSDDNGLKDTSGNLLDGTGDGTAGDDFSDTFTVAASTSEIGVQDFVRGPGQKLNLPANSTTGIPISISDGAAVRNATFAIDYNPNLLTITGVVPGASVPAGSTATVDTSTPGQAVVTFTSPTDLPAGPNELVNLQANVPTANAVAIYGEQHVFDINSILLTNAAGTQLPAIDNDGLHVVAFFGDVSGNGGINASDASQVARLAVSLDTGFAEFLLTDAMIVGDISGNGVINATDASMVARHAVELPVDEIPPIPGGVVVAESSRTKAKQDLVRTPTALVPSPLTIHDWPKAVPASTALGFDVPAVVPHAAIDSVLAGLENPEAADDDELPPALEDAVEQLLSASEVLGTG